MIDSGENQTAGSETTQEIEPSLYSLELQVQTREFKGQISGLTKCALAINCNSLEEFKNEIWLKIGDKLKREVIFNDTDPQWHDQISPNQEDLDRFVLFYNAKSRRSVVLNKVTTVTLNHWRSKEVWLYVHVYSMSVSNLTLWKKVQKSLIEPLNRDRAGASTISEMNILVGQLKEIHRLHYQSSHINWIMWANRIQASEPHLKEKMIHSPPPADMLHLFAVAKTSADDRIVDLRQNLSVAKNVNDGMSTGLCRIRNLFASIRELQQTILQLQNEQQVQINLLEHELNVMETECDGNSSCHNKIIVVFNGTSSASYRKRFWTADIFADSRPGGRRPHLERIRLTKNRYIKRSFLFSISFTILFATAPVSFQAIGAQLIEVLTIYWEYPNSLKSASNANDGSNRPGGK